MTRFLNYCLALVVSAILVAAAGCGSSNNKTENPKLADPNAPKLEPKKPSGPPGPKQEQPAGPKGGVQ